MLVLATSRVAAAFLLIPAFAPQVMPPLVRNSIFLSLSLLAIIVTPLEGFGDTSRIEIATMFSREFAIGLTIGFFFGTFLWALEAAGNIMDAQVGMQMAQVVDPLTGHQTSLSGAFLARLGNYVFMASGGLMLMSAVLLQSYATWPPYSADITIASNGFSLFSGEFQRLMTTALLFAAPALVLLLTVDFALGLVNRYAQQLNVFSLSLSIKAWISVFVLLVLISGFVTALVKELASRPDIITDILSSLFPETTP